MTWDGLCRRYHHHHLAAFEFGIRIDFVEAFQVFQDVVEDFLALVDAFAAFEAHGDLYLVALGQEFFGLLDFDLEVVLVDHGAEFELFDVDYFLILFGFLLFLLGFVFVFAIVENLAYGGHGLRGNLDQIEARLVSHLQGVADGDDAVVVAFVVNKPDFFYFDFFINARSVVFAYWSIRGIFCYCSLRKWLNFKLISYNRPRKFQEENQAGQSLFISC